MEAAAAGLPALAHGVSDAVRGFKEGDPFAGSAAVMDICATTASMLGAMSAAGGPPGALVGAVFSIASMILKLFVKEQVSLSAQLEKMIVGVAAEDRLHSLITAQQAIRSFTTTVSAPGTGWTLSEYEAKLNVIDGQTINAIRNAAQWLEEPRNQEQKLWGEVLACQCQAYSLLKHALTIAIAGLEEEPEVKMKSIVKLTAMYDSNDADQLSFAQRMVTAARRQGRIWHIGTVPGNVFRPDCGALFVKSAGDDDWHDLGGMQREFAVAQRRGSNALDPDPYVAIFCLEPADLEKPGRGVSSQKRENARAYGRFGKLPLSQAEDWVEIPELHGCHDIAAIPGAGDKEVTVFVAKNGAVECWNHGGRFYKNRDEPLVVRGEIGVRFQANFKADLVCAVANPRIATETVGDKEPPPFALYVGGKVESRRMTLAHFPGHRAGFIKALSADAALKADRTHLWSFSQSRIACVTHTAVLEALAKGSQPRWYDYDMPAELDSIRAFAPCDDGTVLAALPDGGAQRLCEATPVKTDNPRRLNIGGTTHDAFGNEVATHGWTRRTDADARRVQKDPLFCFALLEGMIDALGTRPLELSA